jgi:pimeloyl-ACP methyl ester carboxylesterase
MNTVTYHTVDVEGTSIFYREAGTQNSESILLLHGFPSAGHMFRNLIPLLADRYHVIAPDLPGFGQSAMPARNAFAYTFANIANVIAQFTDVLKLDRFAIYIFDYGAPVGLRLALVQPERISAIISQNGNAYDEGLSEGWNPIRAYWNDPSPANRDALRTMLTPETTYWQYTHGAPDASLISPDGYSLDDFYLGRPGVHDAQLDLLLNYATNVALYPAFHAYFKKEQPPLLAVWGKNDPFFLPAGAEAFKRDLPNADVRFVDAGHFALETHCPEIADAIVTFLSRTPVSAR